MAYTLQLSQSQFRRLQNDSDLYRIVLILLGGWQAALYRWCRMKAMWPLDRSSAELILCYQILSLGCVVRNLGVLEWTNPMLRIFFGGDCKRMPLIQIVTSRAHAHITKNLQITEYAFDIHHCRQFFSKVIYTIMPSLYMKYKWYDMYTILLPFILLFDIFLWIRVIYVPISWDVPL